MKEALKLALEALETERDIYREHDEDGAPEYILEAITTIEQALAQPAQEPVAWMREDATLRFAEGKVFAVGQPFYTTPQQRPWVGLTEDEMDKVRQSMGYNQFMSAGEYAKLVQFATQAKLKEKNT